MTEKCPHSARVPETGAACVRKRHSWVHGGRAHINPAGTSVEGEGEGRGEWVSAARRRAGRRTYNGVRRTARERQSAGAEMDARHTGARRRRGACEGGGKCGSRGPRKKSMWRTLIRRPSAAHPRLEGGRLRLATQRHAAPGGSPELNVRSVGRDPPRPPGDKIRRPRCGARLIASAARRWRRRRRWPPPLEPRCRGGAQAESQVAKSPRNASA
jgi:hypothetical protein